AVLGWVSLRQWQRSSELLFREQARDMASMAAEKVEMVLRMSEDAFLDRLQAVLSTGRWTTGEVDALVASAPLVRRLYLVDGRGALLYPVAPIDEDGVVLSRLRAEAATGGWERGGKRELLAGGQVVMAL